MKVIACEKGILLIGSVREVRKMLKTDCRHFPDVPEWIANYRKNTAHSICSLPNSSIK